MKLGHLILLDITLSEYIITMDDFITLRLMIYPKRKPRINPITNPTLIGKIPTTIVT